MRSARNVGEIEKKEKSNQSPQLGTTVLDANDNHRKPCTKRAKGFLFVNCTIIKILVTSNVSSIAFINNSAL